MEDQTVHTTPFTRRRFIEGAVSSLSYLALSPASATIAQASQFSLGTKRGLTEADRQAVRSYHLSDSNVVFSDVFTSPDSISSQWTVFTDDRSDLKACRSAKSLKSGRGGLSIETVAADNCHDKWSTGELISKQTFQYGFFEAKIQIADSSGFDNAFWLTTQNGTNDGSGDEFEIDIAEVHYPNDIHMTLHRHNLKEGVERGELGFDHKAKPDLAAGFHDYGLLWTKDELIFCIDGAPLGAIDTQGVITGPANIRLSTALAAAFGALPASPIGMGMRVQKVRVLAL